jgi:hypothetical protein
MVTTLKRAAAWEIGGWTAIEGGSNHRSPWGFAPDLPFHVAATRIGR